MNPSYDSTIINTLNTPLSKKAPRYYLLKLILIIVSFILLSRSFYLQILHGSSLQLQAEDNRIAVIPQIAPRGIIYDRSGNQLVENIASTDLVLDPNLLPSEENEGPLIENLPKIINIPTDQITNAIQFVRQNNETALLAKAIDHEAVIKIEDSLDILPGIRLSSSSVRNYLYPYSHAHILGYTSLASDNEIKQNPKLLMTENTGKAGIELQYDEKIRGTHGATYMEINAAGRPQKKIDDRAAVPGQDITLTIDSELQNFVFNLLAEKKISGSIIVMDIRDGSIWAMASYPSYNPNIFSQPALQEEASRLLQDTSQPLFSRAIKGTYPPGSTIKPLLAGAGLQEGIISSSTTVLSTGGVTIGPWRFPDWKNGGHGITNVDKAISESVNTFFYILTGGDSTHQGLGVKKANEYLSQFSWGEPTGIDLPGESSGLLPTPEWKYQTKKEQWYIGDTYHLGIGQGDVLVTPLQVATATSAIANFGTVFKPHILKSESSTIDSILTIPSSTRLEINRQNLAIVQNGMRQAVTNGSARQLDGLPIAVAGKTGTAQFGPDEEDTHAWFTSFGPFITPEITITVLLEKGGKGDIDAIPVAREVWQWWAEKSPLKK